MKKSMSFIAAIAMAATMVSAIPASATEITNDTEQSSTVTLSHTEAATYKVVIPADTAFDDDATLEIEASDVCVNFGQAVKVNVSSDNGWKMIDKANNKNEVPYTAKLGDTVLANEAQILEVAKDTGSAIISIEAPDYEYAGTYEDKLTFTVSVGDVTSAQQGEPSTGE